MSFVYREDELRFRLRISELKQREKKSSDKEEIKHLQKRIAELQVLLRQSRELAELTKNYYNRGKSHEKNIR